MNGGTVRRTRPRIVDVAGLAGVSRQTVSNVINGREGFTEETRVKVEAAIAELGFQPNRYAQSLRSQRTMLLGFDMSGQQLDVVNPFTITFLRTLVAAADTHRYRVVVFMHEHAADGFRGVASAGVVDGFVLSDSPPQDGRARILAEEQVPFIAFGRTAPDLPQAWVDIDNRHAMFAVVDHLVARGCRRFSYVGYPTDVYWDVDRLAGVRERLQFHGLSLRAEWTLLGTLEQNRDAVVRLLDDPGRPDAVISSSDSLAVMVVNLAHSLGVRVGADLAVTGFDAGPLTTMVEPTLTSVRIPTDQIARALVDHLMAGLRGSPLTSGVIVPTNLVLGGSA